MSAGQPSAHGLEAQGFRNLKAVHLNLSAPALYERAVARGEGVASAAAQSQAPAQPGQPTLPQPSAPAAPTPAPAATA